MSQDHPDTPEQPPSDARPQGVIPPEGGGGHRFADANIRGIVLATIALLAVMALVHLVLAWIYLLYRSQQRERDLPPPPMAQPAHPPPAPTLQVNPPGDMARLRQAQEALLHSYGWVDRGSGVVRIPIDQAMALAAQGRRAGAGERPAGTQPAPAEKEEAR